MHPGQTAAKRQNGLNIADQASQMREPDRAQVPDSCHPPGLLTVSSRLCVQALCTGTDAPVTRHLSTRGGESKVVKQMTDSVVDPAAGAEADVDNQAVTDLDATEERGVSADLVRAYLNGIGRTRLLTAVQEVELARRIEAGLFAEEKLYGTGGVDAELRADLATIIAEGRAAKDHLLEANLRLVVSIAK